MHKYLIESSTVQVLDESEPPDDVDEDEQPTSSEEDESPGSDPDVDSIEEEEYARLRNGGAQGNFDYYQVCS